MRENVIIAYRGASYELGQWPYGYGIWSTGTEQSKPDEAWPATPDGWSAAWHRFVALEAAGTIVPVGQPSADRAAEPSADGAAQPSTAQPSTDLPSTDLPSSGGAPGSAPAGPPPGITTAPLTADPAQATAEPVTLQPFLQPSGALHQGYAAGDTGQQHVTGPYRPQYAHPDVAWQPARTSPSPRVAAALLAAGVACGVAGLFPAYQAGTSLAAQSPNLVPHLMYLATWAVSAILITLGGRRQFAGALLGTGTSVITLGLLFSDVGFTMAGDARAGAGLVLTLVGWLGCAAGSALALGRWPHDWPRIPRGRELGLAAILVVAALGTAIAFAPSWDSYTLRTAAGQVQKVTLGNAFANPAPVIVGNVGVMVCLFAVVVAAALWRPARLGAALAAGAIIPMVAQLVSAFIMNAQQTPPTTFGISPSSAAAAGLTISNGFTTAFWAYLAFVIILAGGCVWLAVRRGKSPSPSSVASLGATGPAEG